MLRITLICLLLSLPFGTAQAAPGDTARAAIQKLAPMQQLKGFRKSALPGYYEGVIVGQVVYASEDGQYVIRGQVDNVTTGANLTEDSMAERRLEVLATIGADMRLSYEPPKPVYRVTVFTDVDCPFCRRLHAQIADYNQLGIAIDYVFFPLSIHPDADKKSADVWCAPDRKAAYDTVMNGHKLDRITCDTPIVKAMKAGTDIGVNATPTAIGPDGRVITSAILMTPRRLLAELQKTPVAVAAETSP
jgi:thiol:disulfide interchange protein DsbC